MAEILHHKHHHKSSDQLDGVDLKDGEKLSVVWPSGKSEAISVKVVVRKCDKCSSHEAYFVSQYQGRDAWSRLLGLQASRV